MRETKNVQKIRSARSRFEILFNVDKFYIYPFYFADISLTSSIKKAVGGSLSRVLVEFSKDHADYYADVNEANNLGKKVFAKILRDRNYFRIVEKNIFTYGKKLMKFCRGINRIKVSGLTNGELYDIYHQYKKLIISMRDWGWVPVVLDGIKTPYLSNYLMDQLKKISNEKKLSGKDVADYYSLLTSSERKSEVMQEEIARLSLVSKILKKTPRFKDLFLEKDNAKLAAEIQKKHPGIYLYFKEHTKDFGWLTYYYIGPSMSVTDLIKTIRNDLASKESPEKQIEKNKKHFRELPTKKAEIIKKLKLPQELIYLFDVSSFFTYLKDHRKGIYQKSYVAMDLVIEEVAKRLKLTINEVKYLVEDEIEGALLKNKDFHRIVAQRIEYCVYHVHKGEAEVLIGDEAARLMNKYISKPAGDIIYADQLKGTVAYSGKAKGVVKIVINKGDVDKVKDGDILVSSATNPDLIIAMKKSAAFVTDRGGITSHAAIVSRELKKPCVVGTGNATKVLKDGDLVEVDAEKGIVIKLNNKKQS